MLPNSCGCTWRSSRWVRVAAVTSTMMKMIRTLASEARSLAMTRATVFIAGAWTLSFRIHSTQKIGTASLSAWIVPELTAAIGTTASRPISPLPDSAQRSRAMPSDRPAKRADSGAVHRRMTYSTKNTVATTSTMVVRIRSTSGGRPSTDDKATASRPAARTIRWKARHCRPACPKSDDRKTA